MATEPNTELAGETATATPTPAPATRLQQARERTSQLAETARDAGEKLSENPLAVLAGGLAVGAILGIVIPISRREKDLLSPVGSRVSSYAREATQQAVEQGRSKLNEVTGQLVTQVGSAVADAVSSKD